MSNFGIPDVTWLDKYGRIPNHGCRPQAPPGEREDPPCRIDSLVGDGGGKGRKADSSSLTTSTAILRCTRTSLTTFVSRVFNYPYSIFD
jgi:hypothetical protein